LLQDHLTFNPYLRKEAKELLKSPLFDRVRDSSLEEKPEFKLTGAAVEIDVEGAFDYDNGSSIFKTDALIMMLE